MLKKFAWRQPSIYRNLTKSFSVQENPPPPEIKKCFYEALGVQKNATKEQIKENYLKLGIT